MSKEYSIFIIGAGQIGSRHLQALKKVGVPLNITVVEPNEQSLNTAKERYDSMSRGTIDHKITYKNRISEIKKSRIDIAIIATCSDIRAESVKNLLEFRDVKYLILEKILFNKKSHYSEIRKIIAGKKIRAWINCPMRMMPAYQNIEKYFKNKKISYSVTGSQFGLITNAIHYLDHAAYLSGTTDFKIDASGLESKTIKSKRKGFIEFNGTLNSNFKNGSNVSLTCYSSGEAPVIVEIHTDSARYIGRESEGKAWFTNIDNGWKWEELEAPISFQSQLTNILVEKILKTGKCDLVSYEESEKIHLNLLAPLLVFLNKNSKKRYSIYPFT